MLGKRNDCQPYLLGDGEYGLWNGVWYARPPGFPGLANLKHHKIDVNIDETITVTPSILVKYDDQYIWHGYLTNGVWIKLND